jgi:hypothetical protein
MKFTSRSIFVAIGLALLAWMATHTQVIDAQPMIPNATGQQAVTGTAMALPNQRSGVTCVKADPNNTSPAVIYVGLSPSLTTSNGYGLGASESVCTSASNLNTFYVIASGTGATVDWITFNNAGQ